jgi:glycosyltransferase involved in cell wall biosynthesis
MRILFVTNRLAMGGIETNLVLLTREFTRRGHEVVVAAAGGILTGPVTDAGARVVPLRSSLRSPRAVRHDVAVLRRLLRQERPDVVHLFSATAAILHALASLGLRRRPRAVVSSVMGLENDPDESHVVTQGRNLLMTLRARKILIISPTIGIMLRRLPVRRSRLVDLPVVGVHLPPAHRASPRQRSLARDRLGIPAEAPFVVTIGALAPRKSHSLFLEAAAAVHRKRLDAHFAIVGTGPEHDDLEKRIVELGLGTSGRLLGYVETLDDVFAAADVVVKPGIVEGFIGITVLEAQVRHLPVIAFETEDVKEAIRDGKTGLIVPRSDTVALADAIIRLLEDPPLAARLAKAGARHAQQRFAIDNVVQGLESFYRDLVASTR